MTCWTSRTGGDTGARVASFASELPGYEGSQVLKLWVSARRYTFTNEQGVEEEKVAVLSEEDKVWCEVRHMHMKDALDKLIADFKSYAGEHGGTFGAG